MEDEGHPASNPQIQHQTTSLQSFQAADNDDILLQTLSDLPTISWLPDSSNPNPNPLLHPLQHHSNADFDAFLCSTFLHRHDLLSKLQHFSPMAASFAESVLLKTPSSFADAERPSFISTPQGAADDSVQALNNAALPPHQPFQAGEIPAILQTQQGYNAALPAQKPFQAAEIPDLNEPPPSEQAPETQTARARTGPRSVTGRQRMVKIADWIKVLQLLFPNVNETDKDAILDEIVQCVKFLQAAVEDLSMTNLQGAAPTEGGAGSSHEGMSLTEQQELVLKLMEVDMGTAMLYLQSKGLHLVPVWLATDTILTYFTNGKGHGVEAQPSSSNHPRSTVQPSIVID